LLSNYGDGYKIYRVDIFYKTLLKFDVA